MGINRRRGEAQDRLQGVVLSWFWLLSLVQQSGCLWSISQDFTPRLTMFVAGVQPHSWPGLQQGWKCKTELLPLFPIFKLTDKVQAQCRSLKIHSFCLSQVHEGKGLSLRGLLLSCKRELHQI